MRPKINHIGTRYNMLIVVSQQSEDLFECLCDCGKITLVKRRYLSPNGRKSCGCLNDPKFGINVDFLPEYRNWQKAKQRCFDKNNNRYSTHGGRGITMCERWKNSFENFFNDMGKRPTSKHSLDRIDNDKGYCPENCRWATLNEQARNKRNTIKINTPDGIMSVHDAAEKYGLNVNTLKSRINYGIPEKDLLSKNNLKYESHT